MTYYHKCTNCAADKATCSRRKRIKDAIAGLSITSIKFACTDRVSLFRPGQRVEFDWKYWNDGARDIYGEAEQFGLVFHGTVASELERQRRFIVRVDQRQISPEEDPDLLLAPKDVFKNGGFAVKVKPAAMRALPEDDVGICPDCFGYDALERCHASEYVRPSELALCQIAARNEGRKTK